MKIDETTLENVAKAARLELTKEEKQKFFPQLKEALHAFSELNEIDTESVEPSFHPVKIHNRVREDKEETCLSQEEALSLTKHKKDGYFMGPRAV